MRMRVVPASGLLSLAIVLAPLGAQQTGSPQPRITKISLEQYFDLEDVQDPQLSPDGKQIIYRRRWVDSVSGRWVSPPSFLSADGSGSRLLVAASNAVWS